MSDSCLYIVHFALGLFSEISCMFIFYMFILGVCPSKMTEYNRLCLKNCHLFRVEKYISLWSYMSLCSYVPLSPSPRVHMSYRNRMPLCLYVLLFLWPDSLYPYVPESLCLFFHVSLCPYIPIFLFPYVPMSLFPYVPMPSYSYVLSFICQNLQNDIKNQEIRRKFWKIGYGSL